MMTKKDIVKTISEETGLPQLKTGEVVQKTFDAIIEALSTHGRIELRNFGVFEVKKRAARRARNPRTGDKVIVPEKYVVTFRPGKEMEARVKRVGVGVFAPNHTPPATVPEHVMDPPPAISQPPASVPPPQSSPFNRSQE